ncbi:MAG: ABC transporter ATP-binding protein [Acidimicrobiia bacterium]|nr:ABC transporter ATP-binding protein [Acidimicrobiia bacterium]
MDGRIEVAGLAQRFASPIPVDVLAGLDLVVGEHEFASLIGPSGCGKSTVLRVLAGLLVPSAGSASIGGQPAIGRPGLAAFMPQRDTLLPWRRALANATLGAEVAGVDRAQARAAALALFERFGLAGFERAWPAQLSGGMRQRVALLRTLLAGRPALLLDEPLGALDAMTRRELQTWLAALLSTEPRTTLLVTHDVDEALLLSDRVHVLSPRPATLRDSIDVPFERPRSPGLVTHPTFVQLKARVLDALEAR